MKNIILIGLLGLLGCTRSNEKSNEYQQTTVEKSATLKVTDTIREWNKASSQDRLNLCTAMATIINKESKSPGMNLNGLDLQKCIEAATVGIAEADKLTIIQVASLCSEQLWRQDTGRPPMK